VAADEGVMPQTREHLAILDILHIENGVIVLTKSDLIDDPEWLDLVEADVRQVVQTTSLVNAPILRVSARTGQGLDELKLTIQATLAQTSPRPDLNRPRLSVDRVFTIAGFGTVVTGTLMDGTLRLGDEVELLPGKLRSRVRNLQTHKKKENVAVPGSRTAVNLAGLDVDQIQRGMVVVHPGKYQPTQRIDCHFRLLPDASAPILHNSEVKFFIGASEVVARLRLLGVEQLNPGEEGWLQLELQTPVVAVRGDRYILRRPSPGETLGGGVVVDAQPTRRHKRFDPAVIQKLEAYRGGSPLDVLLQASLALGAASLKDLVNKARLGQEVAAAAIQELVDQGEWMMLEKGPPTPTGDLLVMQRGLWEAETHRALAEVSAFHANNPLRRGMPREELKSRLKATPRFFQAALRRWQEESLLAEMGTLVRLVDFQPVYTLAQQESIRSLLARFAASPYAPPTIKECIEQVGEDVFTSIIDRGDLVAVSPEVVFRKEDYDRMTEEVKEHIAKTGSLTAAEFRDLYNTSRRYALAFLEHLDAIGITLRDGDVRRLRPTRK
jgi:selenocysteine-specific elongation factor